MSFCKVCPPLLLDDLRLLFLMGGHFCFCFHLLPFFGASLPPVPLSDLVFAGWSGFVAGRFHPPVVKGTMCQFPLAFLGVFWMCRGQFSLEKHYLVPLVSGG